MAMNIESPDSYPRPTQDLTPRGRYNTALKPGSRNKPTQPDPLVHYGRHFGRTIHAFCNIHALLENAVRRMVDPEDSETSEEDRTIEERKEIQVFQALIRLVPRLEESIMTSSTEKLRSIGDSLTKGANSARSDDTKSLKSAVLDWITPRGVALVPPIAKNVKIDRGFNHEATGALLCPAGLDWSDSEVKKMLRDPGYAIPGDNWPICLYKEYKYDPVDPWKGLLRSKILLSTYRHIFTSPSSVEKEPKATRSGNARIHGMTKVTIASIAYAATQLRFALSSAGVFTRSDMIMDSERFYNSVVDLLEDPQELVETNDLLKFWNRQIFPEQIATRRPPTKNSPLEKLKERRIRQNNRSAALEAY